MKAYERLLKYVTFWTTSDEESETCPSTARQKLLGEALCEEMRELGLNGVRMDENGYVYGCIPASAGLEAKPALGFIAHMDTAPDASGENVKPVLHPDYDGGDIVLNGTVIDTARFPFLASLKGRTVITSDGTTLLGSDDKAGIAEILTACEEIITRGLPHPKLCIAFTPDEEIGRGADRFDIPGFGADFAYTVDGGEEGEIEYENFNAASAVVTVKGFSVHPGSAKDTMINAANVAIDFHSALPRYERPEHTEGREGFCHLTYMEGDVTETKLYYIIRDHDMALFNEKKARFERIAERLNAQYGEGTVSVAIKDSYYNMIEKIEPHFHLIENARLAIEKAGLAPKENPVRGGTDGARLSWDGLPCPNLGTGGYNFHGCAELNTIEGMDKSTEIILNLVELYSK